MSMNVVVTGATGAIGRRAVRELIAAGHEVRGVVREGGERVAALGAEPVRADVFDGRALRAAFAGADAVVNLLTRIPPVERMALPGAWRETDRLRREASWAIAQAAREAGAQRLVQESIVLLYADGGDRWLDEDAPVEPAGPAAASLDAERAAEAFGDAAILRFGLFMAPDSDQTQAQLAQARRGVSPGMGAAGAYVPTVWLDDAGAAVAAALTAPAGTYNVADADPVTRAEADAALAAVVGRERLHAPMPAVARAVPALRPMTRSLRVDGARLREATGWAPAVRAGTEGWALAARAAGVAA